MSIVFIEILLKNYLQLMKNSLLSNYKEKMVLLYMAELLEEKEKYISLTRQINGL